MVGCIQRESDYRQAQQQGRGGAMGTGIGAGNEFVLVNASMSGSESQSATGATASDTAASGTAASGTTSGTASGTTSGTASGTTPGTASGTAGTTGSSAGMGSGATSDTGAAAAGTGEAYRLTGTREGELEQHVGQRVEIVGSWEDGDQSAGATRGTSGTGTGAETAGEQSFEDLREIDITSFRAVGGTCQTP